MQISISSVKNLLQSVVLVFEEIEAFEASQKPALPLASQISTDEISHPVSSV